VQQPVSLTQGRAPAPAGRAPTPAGRSPRPPEPLPPPTLWRHERRGAIPHDADIATPSGPQPRAEPSRESPGGLEPGPPLGIERRLVRRAEALWDTLRAGAPLPPAAAAQAFRGRLFEDHSVDLALPPRRTGRPAGAPHMVRIGQALASLGLPPPGHPSGFAGAAIPDRFAALAEEAATLGKPALLEMDTSETLHPPAVPSAGPLAAPAILLRAVALPFAPPEADPPSGKGPAGQGVVVVASWRHLLPPDEAAALCRELERAVGQLRHPG
jgi:hypothetical protein